MAVLNVIFVSASGIVKQDFYRGLDCIDKLLDMLRDWLYWCYGEKQMFRRLVVSEQQRKRMLNVANVSCCLCGMDVEKTARVIHHCHLSGTIFGVAHSKCNLRARTTNFLPVFFHNLSRYDAHHILKHLKLKVGEELSAIAKTDQIYISFSINIPVGTYKKQSGQLVKLYQSLRFLDSYQFVSQSLENLAKTLKKDDFFLLKQIFHNVPDQTFLKLTQKGFFLYSYPDSFEKFKEAFPNYGDAWRNSLSGKIDIAYFDYRHAVSVYNDFGCQNLGDYHDVYLKTDVLLLADIFEKFRSVCLNVYKLDPSHFFSAPNLSWESMLISTRVKLGLLQDIDMLLFFERGIRGGIIGVGELKKIDHTVLMAFTFCQVFWK